MKHHARQHRVSTAGKQRGHQILESLPQQLWLAVWCHDRDQGLDDPERSSFTGCGSRGGTITACIRGGRGDVHPHGGVLEGGWSIKQACVYLGKRSIVIVND